MRHSWSSKRQLFEIFTQLTPRSHNSCSNLMHLKANHAMKIGHATNKQTQQSHQLCNQSSQRLCCPPPSGIAIWATILQHNGEPNLQVQIRMSWAVALLRHVKLMCQRIFLLVSHFLRTLTNIQGPSLGRYLWIGIGYKIGSTLYTLSKDHHYDDTFELELNIGLGQLHTGCLWKKCVFRNLHLITAQYVQKWFHPQK